VARWREGVKRRSARIARPLGQSAANSEASSDFRLAFGAAPSVGRRHSNRYRGARPDVQSLEYLASMRRSSAFYDMTVDERVNAFAAEFVRGKKRAIVHDPAMALRFSPRQTIGCRRCAVGIGYYETFNQLHLRLVDVSDPPLERITSRGVVAAGANMHSTRWRPPFALTRDGRPMRLALTGSRGQRPDYFQRLRNFER
jgi:hypothetical protein